MTGVPRLARTRHEDQAKGIRLQMEDAHGLE